MKTETWILLGIGAYWLYSQSQRSHGTMTYPTYQGGPYVPGSSRSTGSGGTTASLPGGINVSVTNPPVGGVPGNPSWNPLPTGINHPGSGYVQCLDGSWASEEWQCAENYYPGAGEYTCQDGEVVSDPSHCPEAQGL